jgi:hypothetical protein
MFPFNLWMTCMEASFEGVKLAVRFSEMAFASHTVIGARTGIIREAVRKPLDGDYAEMSRMVMEKLVGFSQAWTGALMDLWKLQIGLLTLGSGLPALLGGGKAVRAKRTRALKDSARLLRDGSGLAGRAVAPLHRKVSANARRLQRAAGPSKASRAKRPR